MESTVIEFVSSSPEETLDLGRQFAQKLKAGDVVALYGELGAGKTIFTQGVCQGLGYTGPVNSPSFVHLHCYPHQPRIYHADFYLAKSPADIRDLDLDEVFDEEAIVIIEWAQLFPEFLPSDSWKVEMKWCEAEENRRVIIITQ